MGEAKYNDLQLVEAVNWVHSHPETFVSLSALRFIAFWIPVQNGDVRYTSGWRLERSILYIYLMTALSGAGLMTLYQRDARSAVLCLSCLIAFPLVYYIIEFDDRYRYPIMGNIPSRVSTDCDLPWLGECQRSRPAVQSSGDWPRYHPQCKPKNYCGSKVI